jgi:hypothetical protein
MSARVVIRQPRDDVKQRLYAPVCGLARQLVSFH